MTAASPPSVAGAPSRETGALAPQGFVFLLQHAPWRRRPTGRAPQRARTHELSSGHRADGNGWASAGPRTLGRGPSHGSLSGLRAGKKAAGEPD